jgi:hypothetical protein
VQTQTSVFLTPETVIETTVIQGDPCLRILAKKDGFGGVSLFLGDGGRNNQRAVVIDQLRQLHRAVADMAKPYGGLLALFGPDDDEDDEPEDRIARSIRETGNGPAPTLVYPEAELAPDGDHFHYPPQLLSTER